MQFGSKKVTCAAYYRVSTLLGQSLSNQSQPIRQFCEARNFDLLREYSDEGISGTRERRPALDNMLVDARRGLFKIIVVSALDRLGRNTKHILSLIEELNACGVQLISLREAIDLSTPQGHLLLTLIAAVSQMERSLISDRIRCALKAKQFAAQQSGSTFRLGRPVIVTDSITKEVVALSKRGLSTRQIARALNQTISRTSVHRILKLSRPACPKNLHETRPISPFVTFDEIDDTQSTDIVSPLLGRTL